MKPKSVELLMAMEESQAWIIGNKINLHLLIAAQHHYVLQNPGGVSARQICKFEAVAMKVDRMDVVTGVAHLKAIAFALF